MPPLKCKASLHIIAVNWANSVRGLIGKQRGHAIHCKSSVNYHFRTYFLDEVLTLSYWILGVYYALLRVRDCRRKINVF